ncbi:hypothetical protein [Pseudoprimorskyibacter insulae]|nr:hypothetical protein [Pseudoprimorskyibacter insulae]
MKHLIVILALLAPMAANAACYADYKAKQDDPLRLHYGVAELGAGCTLDAARDELNARLAEKGWTLLTVVSVFDDAGLVARGSDADFTLLGR